VRRRSARLGHAAFGLRHEVAHRRFRHHLIAEGMAMLASKSSPMHVQDRLNSFLRPEAHDYFDYFDTPTTRAAPHLKVVGA
jgi:hypothetical protein